MLTKTLINQTKPRPTRYVVWDGEDGMAGFGLRVAPSGRRNFILSYRLKGTRRAITATLGVYGKITLDQARKAAKELLAKVELGHDPQAGQKARAAAEAMQARILTVDKLVGRYIDALRSGTAMTKRLRGRAATRAYITDIELHLRRFCQVRGKEVAADVTRAHVLDALNGYTDQSSAHRRMHGAISRMYAWARRQELVANNPTVDIETAVSLARDRVLSLPELAQVWRAAEQLDPLYRDYVHLMITTAQRRTEVAGMTWAEIDVGQALWTLPMARTKARRQHTIPLPRLTMACLQTRLAALENPPKPGSLVLPTIARDGKGEAPISGWNWLKEELNRRAEIAPWRLHDFRRSLVTHCAEHGADIAVLDTLLNHASSATRGGIIGVYQRATLLGPMREVMTLWNRLLQEAIESTMTVAQRDTKIVALAAVRL